MKKIQKSPVFIAFITLIPLLIYGCVKLPDEDAGLEPDNVTSDYAWEGELDKFTINTKVGIKLNDFSYNTGTAYATFPSSSVRNTRWEFGLRLTFNPSSTNFARFYLASSSKNLAEDLNGYFVQIGGTKDNVSLFMQKGSVNRLLISSKEILKGDEKPKLYIKVECDANGIWTLYTRMESETEYTKVSQKKDTDHASSICCGVYGCYTKSRSRGMTFHHIRISEGVDNVEQPDDPDLPDRPDLPDVPELPAEVRNMLQFNEVMFDNSSDGAEYIELFNPADTVVSVSSLKLLRYVVNAAGESVTKTTAILKQDEEGVPITVSPKGYICLTKSASKVIKKHKITDKSTIIEIRSFPQIANEGGYLAIKTDEKESRMIDKCSYFESMHSTGNKRNQGISLEKKSPEINSAKNRNWHSSRHASGGTPGTKNSE